MANLALVEAARAGEPRALEHLLALAQPELKRYAFRSCMISDVDDAVQEALLVLSRSVTSLRHARAWSRWTFRIIRRECHRLARVTLRQDIWDDERTEAALAGRSEDGLRRDVAAAIESLPDSYREVVVLRDLEELAIGEIATRLNTTPAAVKGRLHRAREMIREYLLA